MLNITNSAEPTSLGLKQMLGQYPHQDLTYVKCEPPEATLCSVIWQILIFYSFCYSSHTTNITWFTAKLRLWDVLSLLALSNGLSQVVSLKHPPEHTESHFVLLLH